MGKMPIRPGQTLDGRYELRREIAFSGRSLLFEAEHPMTGRVVAVKVQRPGQARVPIMHTAFEVQVRLHADCAHPSVVQLLDAGTIDLALDETVNVPYLVIEMLDGRSLEGIIGGRGTMPVAEVVQLGVGLCRALARIHRAGVVHGAVSPAHIMVPPKPEGEPTWEGSAPAVKLIDFSQAAGEVAGVRYTPTLNQEGMEYQSPEQLSEEDLTAATDVYSLGVVLYECLTGNPPVGRIIVPPHKLNKDVPPPMSTAIEAAVQRKASERPQSAQAFAEALSKAPPAPPPRKPPKPRGQPTRRATHRVAYVAPVEIRRDVGLPIEARCEDISVGGMMVVSGAKLEDKERVVVHFALPGNGETVIAPAVVCWRKAARNNLYVGLQLDKLSAKANAAIEQHVERLRANQ
ncbi:MAG: PilZ domain-containing protein [Deltaproteobacteria bacterium]|nr:PilZ domain-containing protein [Deltaproteobacteria bacterium]